MKRYWTREKVIEVLMVAMTEIEGPLPCDDRSYNHLRKDRSDWAPVFRILEYYHSMARAWLAAGAPKNRVSLRNIKWTPQEDNYLLTYAGIFTLNTIAAKLCRSYGSVKTRLNKNLKRHARTN